MKRALVAVGVLWLVILGGLAGMQEYTLQTGQEILLQTEPVDPRDLFRGDYVTLGYDISSLDMEQLGAAGQTFSEGQEIYVLLQQAGNYHVASGVRSSRPAGQELFLKGRVTDVYGKTLWVEYGIESYFVPEGKGLELEQARGRSLNVKASVDRSGRAVLKALLLDGRQVRFK